MKLKQQITVFALLGLLVPAILITSFSIYKIKTKAETDIAAFEADEYSKLKLYLKHITDVAYGLVETRFAEAKLKAKSDSTVHIPAIMDECLADLSKMRFDKGEGYFWVTDNRLPYPTMLMHAEKANLRGVILDDASFNVEKHKLRNIYQVRAELCNTNGDAFVDYIMKKPGTSEVENKISYSRLYPELGWIISAGFYTDQIAEAVAAKKDALSKQIRDMMLIIITITLVIVLIGVGLSLYFSGKLSRSILLIRDKLKALASGLHVDELAITRKDEVGEMTQSLNLLVSGLRSYTAFAKDIGQGNLTREFAPLSNEDVLGNELLQMRSNLKAASDEKNIRDWFNEGLAKLGDVLRRNNNDTRSLADEILRSLVGYLKMNQGGLSAMYFRIIKIC